MVSGYPDWHRGVKADISDQTIDNVKVDINYQTLPEISTTVRTYQAESVETIHTVDRESVPSYDSKRCYIFAPEEYLYEVLGLYLFVEYNPAATAGLHYFEVRTAPEVVTLTRGASTYDSKLDYTYNHWRIANKEAFPPSDTAQLLAVRGVRVDHEVGLTILYNNGTDAVQDAERYISLLVRKIKVG